VQSISFLHEEMKSFGTRTYEEPFLMMVYTSHVKNIKCIVNKKGSNYANLSTSGA
jgi:hypothetical protein